MSPADRTGEQRPPGGHARLSAASTSASRCYVIDRQYLDRKLGENEFVRWLAIKNAGGMRPMLRQGARIRGNASELAALVLVSRHVPGARYNPWQDVIDRQHGRIWYWGDAKADPRRTRDDFEGNRFLAAVWQALNERRWGDIPPILHFSKHEAGTVRFTGLCVLVELRDAWFEDKGVRVRNYHAAFDILPVDRVPLSWLHARRRGRDAVDVPDEWAVYATTGRHGRLELWARGVQSDDEQLPARSSPEWSVLEAIHALQPLDAERLIVRAFTEMPIAHTLTATPPAKDGGFDFFGELVLPPPLEYAIAIKGEVKRYEPGRAKVGPRDVARLVARLRRGEHGVFVTTAAFSRQCQEEVLSDGYPVDLVPGGRLVGLLQHLGAVRGREIAPEWLAPRPDMSLGSWDARDEGGGRRGWQTSPHERDADIAADRELPGPRDPSR